MITLCCNIANDTFIKTYLRKYKVLGGYIENIISSLQ